MTTNTYIGSNLCTSFTEREAIELRLMTNICIRRTTTEQLGLVYIY